MSAAEAVRAVHLRGTNRECNVIALAHIYSCNYAEILLRLIFFLQIHNFLQLDHLPGAAVTYIAKDEGDLTKLQYCGADKKITLKVSVFLFLLKTVEIHV